MSYFSEKTLNHLCLQQSMFARHRQRSLDITLACKLTLTYGKYHQMMDYRQLAMSKHQMTYQEAERQAKMMSQITIVHHTAADFFYLKMNIMSMREMVEMYKSIVKGSKTYL